MTPSSWIPYCGPGPTPAEWLTRWNTDPWLLAALAAFLIAGVAFRLDGRRRILTLSAASVLALTFVSPLCALSSALFTARTLHHILLIGVVAPLIAYALPRRRAGSLTLATATQAVVFWAWHGPDAYGWALSDDLAYWAMQLSILGSGLWFWMAARSAKGPAAVVALLAAMIAMGLLGAVLAFAPDALYAPHLLTTQAWGLTPLEDQQAAGLIMWAPAAGLYLAAALWRLARVIGPDQMTPERT